MFMPLACSIFFIFALMLNGAQSLTAKKFDTAKHFAILVVGALLI